MAEQRKKTDSILLRTESKIISLELFPAEQWPEENGGAGLFRVRIGSCPTGSGAERHSSGAWHCPAGKYSFLTRNAVGELVAALLNNGEAPADDPAPWLPVKADVRVYLEDSPVNASGSVRVAPYQKRDGRWYCQVWVFGQGVMELCCNDVMLVRERG